MGDNDFGIDDESFWEAASSLMPSDIVSSTTATVACSRPGNSIAGPLKGGAVAALSPATRRRKTFVVASSAATSHCTGFPAQAVAASSGLSSCVANPPQLLGEDNLAPRVRQLEALVSELRGQVLGLVYRLFGVADPEAP
jgi:hypothetical protein